MEGRTFEMGINEIIFARTVFEKKRLDKVYYYTYITDYAICSLLGVSETLYYGHCPKIG